MERIKSRTEEAERERNSRKFEPLEIGVNAIELFFSKSRHHPKGPLCSIRAITHPVRDPFCQHSTMAMSTTVLVSDRYHHHLFYVQLQERLTQNTYLWADPHDSLRCLLLG
jgi:hypothetical protein